MQGENNLRYVGAVFLCLCLLKTCVCLSTKLSKCLPCTEICSTGLGICHKGDLQEPALREGTHQPSRQTLGYATQVPLQEGTCYPTERTASSHQHQMGSFLPCSSWSCPWTMTKHGDEPRAEPCPPTQDFSRGQALPKPALSPLGS